MGGAGGAKSAIFFIDNNTICLLGSVYVLRFSYFHIFLCYTVMRNEKNSIAFSIETTFIAHLERPNC